MKLSIKYSLLLTIALLSSTSSFAATETAEDMFKSMQKNATKPEYIPKSRSVIMFGKQTREAVVVLENPRWVVKGQLYDMWSNTKIGDLSELHSASKKIPLDTVNVDLNKTLTITTNTSKDRLLTVFLDPFKETTEGDLKTLLRYAGGYKLRFVLFTKDRSNESVKRLFTLACDIEGKSANKQLSIIMNQNTKIGERACLKKEVIASYGTVTILGINRSPTLVSSNYTSSEGFPENLTSWLLENMK